MQSRSYNLTIGTMFLLTGVFWLVKPERPAIWDVTAIGILYIIYGLIQLFKHIPKPFDKEEWEYGKCDKRKARRHKKNGNVQFLRFVKTNRKYVKGVGYLDYQWEEFDESQWPNFRVSPLVHSNPPKPPSKVNNEMDLTCPTCGKECADTTLFGLHLVCKCNKKEVDKHAIQQRQ